MELGLGLTKIIPLVVYIVAILMIFLTLFYKIEIGIFFIVPLLPLQNILNHIVQYPLGKDFLDILYIALIIKWFTNQMTINRSSDLRKPLLVCAIAIILWTYFGLWRGSLFLGVGAPLSLSDARFVAWKNYIMLPILYLIVVHNIKDTRQIKILLVLMSFAMLIMDRNFYHNFSGKDISHFSYDLRIEGTFSYLGPNPLAVFYAQYSIILVSLSLLDNHKWRKLLFIITAIFNYYCTIFLYSRGGYLATLISWLFLGFIKDRRVLLALLVFIIFWRSFLPNSVQERIDMSKTEEGIDSSVLVRYELWEKAKPIILQNPILGVGFNSTPFLNFQQSGIHRISLHNGYMEILLEQGVVGLVIYLLFFSFCLRYGWRLYRSADEEFLKGLGLGFVGCVLAVLVGNIFGSYWFYMNVSGFYWVLLALVVRSLELVDKTKLVAPRKSQTKFRRCQLATAR